MQPSWYLMNNYNATIGCAVLISSVPDSLNFVVFGDTFLRSFYTVLSYKSPY
jgi:hypothetical protein